MGEEINITSEEGKVLLKVVSIHELAHTELVLSFNVRRREGKVAFCIIKGANSKRTKLVTLHLAGENQESI
jgi:hypothetical protein